MRPVLHQCMPPWQVIALRSEVVFHAVGLVHSGGHAHPKALSRLCMLSQVVLCPAGQQSQFEADQLQHFMAGEETFASMAALEAAIARDVAQHIDTCHLRASPPQAAQAPASRIAKHPGQISS